MGRPYIPMPVPVLEVTLQFHVNEDRDLLLIDVYRALGLADAIRVHHDHSIVPLPDKILAETMDVVEAVVMQEVQFRWGIQSELGIVLED